jgi:hypothetical protein
LAFVDDKDGQRGQRSSSHRPEADAGEQPVRAKKRPPIPEVGSALRSAYEQAVNEDIPAEMLDLLGKLG